MLPPYYEIYQQTMEHLRESYSPYDDNSDYAHARLSCRERQLLAALTELQTERAAHERTRARVDWLENQVTMHQEIAANQTWHKQKAEAELESLRSELAAIRSAE